MAAHKVSDSLRPRCTRSGSAVAAVPIYHLSYVKREICLSEFKGTKFPRENFEKFSTTKFHDNSSCVFRVVPCGKYKVVLKIFRTGAAIYIAVVVAQRICPNSPNCEIRVMLRSFAATA
jgi:hypothetical protein